MKIRWIKGLWLQLTAEMNTGRAVVELRPDDGTGDGALLTAAEARRLSKALLTFATVADKKNKVGRKRAP